MTVLLLRTERNETERNENGTIEKKDQELNDLAEGPRSRTKRNDLKKSKRAQPYIPPSLFHRKVTLF